MKKQKNQILHEIQYNILNKLALVESARFNELLFEDLESEHMNYHLKQLIKLKYVEKNDLQYSLTIIGKNFVGTLDEVELKVEKQPKISVLLAIYRKNKKTGEIENLVGKRLKHPYFGKVGRLTGKVRFGEKIEEAAQRELLEETGLKANSIKLVDVYHKIAKTSQQETVQSSVFFIFEMTDLTGEFIKKTQFQENIWVNKSDYENKALNFYSGMKLYTPKSEDKIKFKEEIIVTDEY
jgi:ADP-ribose pyrophosphatase YjhB (NUDIX family)